MCNICCEDWSAKVVKTECPYCKFATCQKCMQTYMLDLLNDPKCMHPDCQKTWTMDHMFSILPKSFINGKYKKHRETVLYNREVAMLPATQPHLERTNALNRMMEEYDDLAKRIKELQLERVMMRRAMFDLEFAGASTGPAAPTKVVQQYVGRCGKDNCKGFVSMKGYACGICETKYCDKCFAIKDADHVCNPDDVLTFKAMQKDSKPCPTCAAQIHRTSGCPMMFCTQCNTAWDWNTFKITTNEDQIHNPHYFEWRAANPHLGRGRAPAAAAAALQCAENLTTRQVDAATASLHRDDRRRILAVWGMVEHVTRILVPRFEVYDIPIFERNKDIRIKFLSNETDEKRFKSIVHTREKALNKKREICQILKTFVAVTKECMFEFVHSKAKNVQEVLSQYKAITKFTDESLSKASVRYNCVIPDIALISEARGL